MKRIPLVFLLILGLAAAAEAGDLRRFALFVGADNGGTGRTPLRYAATDATALQGVLTELGGLSVGDSRVLTNPDRQATLTALAGFSSRIAAVHSGGGRSEFLFYYSGHSDDEGLLLGNSKLGYGELRDALTQLGADVRLAVLDSCASGAFTRLKGGTKAPPFLQDESSSLEGHAYLTSSSEDEASQESDRIGGSFFTHYLISGLRGAADSTGDGQVTLTEAYRHAFDETLARTEDTQAGPQHPAYDIQLTGTGDLVLTDLTHKTSRLVIGSDVSGQVFVRTSAGRLLAEVRKKAGETTTLAVPEGDYAVSVQSPAGYALANKHLAAGETGSVAASDLAAVAKQTTRSRGGSDTSADSAADASTASTDGADDGGSITVTVKLPKIPQMPSIPEIPNVTLWASLPWVPFFNPKDPAEEQLPGEVDPLLVNFGLTPFLELFPGLNKAPVFSLYALVSQTAESRAVQMAGLISLSGKVTGAQFSGIGNIVTGSVRGAELGGIFNIARGTVYGGQLAGIFNLSDEDRGAQAAGIFNIAQGSAYGVQAGGIFNMAGGTRGAQVGGIFNSTDSLAGAQLAGILNLSKGAGRGVQVAGIINVSGDLGGIQFGLINVAGRMQGIQFGLLNISKHVDGLAFGLINISDNTYGRLGYDFDGQGKGWTNLQWGAGTLHAMVVLGPGATLDHPEKGVVGGGFGLGFGDPIRLEAQALAFNSLVEQGGTAIPALRLATQVRMGPLGLDFGWLGAFNFPGFTTTTALNSGAGTYSTQLFTSGYTWQVLGRYFAGVSLGF